MGSNLGESVEILSQAITDLSNHITKLKVSSLYISEPMYYVDQPYFSNCVINGNWQESPYELLTYCQSIEKKFGRNRSREIRKGPRTLDIDILFFENAAINTKQLIIPHPGIVERPFVHVPLLELEPDFIEPVTKKPLCEIVTKTPGKDVYLRRRAVYNNELLRFIIIEDASENR